MRITKTPKPVEIKLNGKCSGELKNFKHLGTSD